MLQLIQKFLRVYLREVELWSYLCEVGFFLSYAFGFYERFEDVGAVGAGDFYDEIWVCACAFSPAGEVRSADACLFGCFGVVVAVH